MAFRKLSSNFIFSSHIGFFKNGILVLDKNNTVVDLIDTGGDLREEANLEFYNGILSPGFINSQVGRDSYSGDLLFYNFPEQNVDNWNPGQDENIIVFKKILHFQIKYPQENLFDLLSWGTIYGAKTRNAEMKFGSFENGKNPGVNLIENANLKTLKLTVKSNLRILI
jgi:hypothetical protein